MSNLLDAAYEFYRLHFRTVFFAVAAAWTVVLMGVVLLQARELDRADEEVAECVSLLNAEPRPIGLVPPVRRW